jgi:hypothetical protein
VCGCAVCHTSSGHTFHTRSGQRRYLFQRPGGPRLPRGLAFASSFVFPVFVVAFRGEAAKTRESGVEFFLCVQGFFVSTDCTMPTGVRVRMTRRRRRRRWWWLWWWWWWRRRRRRRRRWWWHCECRSMNAPHLLSALLALSPYHLSLALSPYHLSLALSSDHLSALSRSFSKRAI